MTIMIGKTTKTALVVEDAKDSAMLLARVLEMLGYEARVAVDAATALEAITTAVPDLIFCDIGLPEIDGYELARLLRARPALAQTKLIAVTGFAPPATRSEMRALGFDRFVTKPISIATLRGVLEELEQAADGPAFDGSAALSDDSVY
jgi:CheY-like chemotaxis protein